MLLIHVAGLRQMNPVGLPRNAFKLYCSLFCNLLSNLLYFVSKSCNKPLS
ncbi:hypothetical protein HanOQP8_Chr11g0387531 [Helianthus annuus]|nr:hypothetical protein HanHA89_Chr11g0407151 [Helianthus annuus]KAJ0687810.1 hypothetical protein HanOQP8_Chr11g0387521 [Helianthus annuus]KAJ0687811.1 hypothetical protein HanOQP8_Chr11g0387531 [Helianthus annuus]